MNRVPNFFHTYNQSYILYNVESEKNLCPRHFRIPTTVPVSHMNGKSLWETIETAWMALVGRNASSEAFGSLTPDLIALFQMHCRLADSIRGFQLTQRESDLPLSQVCDTLSENLERNILLLVQQIAEQSSRTLKLHKTSDGESLWRIAKKYDSNMLEIFELNRLENVFAPEAGKLLMIPVKGSQA